MGTDHTVVSSEAGSRSAPPRPAASTLERRAFHRQAISASADVIVTLHGIDDNGNHLDFNCEPVNVSRGGLLARCDRKIVPDSPCVGQFQVGRGTIVPQFAVGSVVRLQEDSGTFLIALEFDEPLDTVALDA